MLHTEYRNDGSIIVTADTDTTTRYVVSPDTLSEDPRTWTPEVQTLKFRVPYLDRDDLDLDPDTGTMAAFIRAFQALRNSEFALMVAQRYARIFEPHLTIGTAGITGYSQGDWCETVTVCSADDDPARYAAVFGSWFRGDVWDVQVQKLAECDSDDCHGDLESHWGYDSAGYGSGASEIYGESAEDAVTQYRALSA